MKRCQSTNRTTIHVRNAAALCALAVLVAACGDSSLSTPNGRSARGASMSRFDGSYSFTYDPSRGITTKLSDKLHSISIPAYGICDPAVSSYGPGTWDDACTPLTTPITITVRSYTSDDGSRPYLDFQPALRFVPSKTTILTFNMKKSTLSSGLTINYCVSADYCVNEAAGDASLITVDDGKGHLSRRIKHFSGYNVAAGVECEVSDLDPDCIDIDGHGLLNLGATDSRKMTLDNAPAATTTDATKAGAKKKRSGYMVVSGLEQEK